MWSTLILVLGVLGCLFNVAFSATPSLGSYNINPNTITVSGLSSGAYMAVQMHVAFSETFTGAAIFAGGPYYCAEGSVNTAQLKCMQTTMGVPNAQLYVNDTNKFFKSNQIDDPANLADDKVFLFSGTSDTTVAPAVMKSLETYYKTFVTEGTVVSEFTFKASHCLPTTNYGNTCTVTMSPYIGKCNYDGAGIAFKVLYGDNLVTGKDVAANLLTFDQSPFSPAKASIGATGYVYVPTACKSGTTQCNLHVSFHGCKQDIANIQDQYAADTGFNSWAEANNIIVLYPYAVSSTNPSNPNSCWDWWGYSGADYVYKSGAQMKFVKDLIDHMLKGSAPVPTAAPTPTGPPVEPVPTLEPTLKPTSGFQCQEWSACVWDHYTAGRAIFSTNYQNYWAKGSNDDLGLTGYCGGAVGVNSPVAVKLTADGYYEKGNC